MTKSYSKTQVPAIQGLPGSNMPNLQDGQAPVYQGTSNTWVNKHVATSEVAFTGTAGDTVIVNSTGDGITSTSVLHVDTVNNRVGINVANPTEDLEIDGNIQIDTSGLGRLIFYDGNDDHEHCELDGDDDGTNGGMFIVKTKVDASGVSEKFRINNKGAIGLGGANYGISGEVLTSQGSTGLPIWSAIGGGGGGITHIDQWRVTADVTSSGDITTNLAQNAFTNVGLLGTGMTESSGIFSFPTTGMWLVKFQALIRTSAVTSYGSLAIRTTDNNSTYITASSLIGYGQSDYYSKTLSCEVILNISDLSNDKVKFTYTEGGTSKIDVDGDKPNFIFIRLGG